MARKASRKPGDEPAEPKAVKVTLRLGTRLARQLAVLAANRHVSQSAVAEEILEPKLRHVRLMSDPESKSAIIADPGA